MKSNLKIIPIILAVGIFFTFSMFSNDNLNFNTGNSDENVDKEKIQISAVSGKIHIDGNSGWVDFKNDGNCTGNGTYSEPYVIEDLVIDGGGSGSCIWIENTNVYFKIENCTLYNFGTGINLRNVTNSLIIDNNANANNIGGTGIYLWHSDNNTITGNIANNNSAGISLDGSDYNTISGNTASDNQQGLYLSYSNNNTILGNYANTNSYGGFGINLWQSNNNTITGNTANNNSHGIGLHGSYYNTVSGNNAN
ncbi:MAG: nitrous oxide reductase family maturation protein NosD, partial [Promethearchaeota archaeon]